MRVLATTRRADRAPQLLSAGVDEVVVDDSAIAERVRQLVPGGVDGGLKLVGAQTLKDTFACTRPGGTVCFTGMWSNKWSGELFYPIDFILMGVRPTAYGGGGAHLPSTVRASRCYSAYSYAPR